MGVQTEYLSWDWRRKSDKKRDENGVNMFIDRVKMCEGFKKNLQFIQKGSLIVKIPWGNIRKIELRRVKW